MYPLHICPFKRQNDEVEWFRVTLATAAWMPSLMSNGCLLILLPILVFSYTSQHIRILNFFQIFMLLVEFDRVSPTSSSMLTYSADLGIVPLHNLLSPLFIIRNAFLRLYIYIYIYIYIHTHICIYFIVSVSLENPYYILH